MTQPGEMERPAAGDPGVSVTWLSPAVREVAGPAAGKLAAGLAQVLDAARAGTTGSGR